VNSTPAGLQVSIVIRALDEAEHVGHVLDAVHDQTLQGVEVVFVDSGSKDGTVDIARRHGARLIHIPPESFSYGYALNLGIREAAAPLIVFLSAHALPDSPHWLEALVAPFQSPEVGAVFGRQVPHPGCNPLERREIEKAFGPEARIGSRSPEFSNANAAVRRDLALKIPFDESMTYAEDRIWAKAVCEAGWTVAYESRAAVLHSHDESFRERFLRQRHEVRESVARLELRSALAHWWVVPPALVWGLARDWIRLLKAREHPAWFLRAPGFRLAKVLGTWHGCRDATRGTP